DRPGSIVANGIHEESRARVDYRFAFLSSRGVNEAHHDKTGQRRGLKKSAGLWLDRLKNAKRLAARQATGNPCEGINGLTLGVPDLSHRDQSWEGIAHDWQAN